MQSVFKALADPTRREIIQLLRAGPKSSGEIAARFPVAWPTVSQRHGQQISYELNTTVFEELVAHVMEWTQPAEKKHA